MKTKLTNVIRKYRSQPDELLSVLSAMTPGELVRGIVDLLTAREPMPKKKPSSMQPELPLRETA